MIPGYLPRRSHLQLCERRGGVQHHQRGRRGNGVTTITRAINGYGLLLAEIPADGAVSDTSDGFFIFVPDLEKEKELNAQSGVTDDYPLEIRAVFYRTDDPNNAESKRVTSETLWISFPRGGRLASDRPEKRFERTELKG